MDPRGPWNFDRKVCIGPTTSFAGSFVTSPFQCFFYPSSSYSSSLPTSFLGSSLFFHSLTDVPTGATRGHFPSFFPFLSFAVALQYTNQATRTTGSCSLTIRRASNITAFERVLDFVQGATKFDCSYVRMTLTPLLDRASTCIPISFDSNLFAINRLPIFCIDQTVSLVAARFF